MESKKTTINLVLNIILLTGLTVLYVLHFTNKAENTETVHDETPPKKMFRGEGSMNIAFIHSDTILDRYQFVKDLRNKLDSKTSQLEAELKKKQKRFEEDAAYFQDAMAKNSLSEESAREIYNELMLAEQELMELREKYSSEIAEEELAMHQLLVDSITNYVDRYNKKYNFDYIFGVSSGGNIFYANDSFNITQSIVRGLNREYKSTSE